MPNKFLIHKTSDVQAGAKTGKKEKIKILITSVGSTNGVNVIKALRNKKEINLSLIAVDIDRLAAGFFLSDKYYQVPKADASNFISTILRICKRENIRIIIPTFSYELSFFARKKKMFEKKGIRMAISDYKTFSITDNKIKTAEYLNKLGISTPKIYKEKEIRAKKIIFPVLIKPIKASGSRGVTKVTNWEELLFFKKYIKDSFIQEFVEGDEYTIDGVSDLKGKMIAASPRVRLETKGGLAVKSRTIDDSQMIEIVKKIVEKFKIIGPFNVQCIKKGKELKFIDINSRFPSGGLPLTVKAGLNIPLILVKLLLGKKVKKPKIKPNMTMTRYWDAIILKKVNDRYCQLL